MRADAALPLPELAPARPGEPTDLLLTGATGFLGPFLVSSLLERTSYTVHALVRATDAGHGLDRVAEHLVDRVDVAHQRIFNTLPAKGAEIDVECEARDAAQLQRLVEDLQASGFAVHPVAMD